MTAAGTPIQVLFIPATDDLPCSWVPLDVSGGAGELGKLRGLQAAVGGYLEQISRRQLRIPLELAQELVLLVDEDARLKGAAINRRASSLVRLEYGELRGDVVFTRDGGASWDSLDEERARQVWALIPSAFRGELKIFQPAP